MCKDYKAFTYLIVNNSNRKWYYGVRYAKDCDVKDLFETYFSSSKSLLSDIQTLGKNSFFWEIRKKFKSIDDAKNWEVKVLRRMNVRTNESSYNQHYNRGFIAFSKENNPAKSLDVREKIRKSVTNRVMSLESIEKGKISKYKINISLLLKSRKMDTLITCKKQKMDLYAKYLQFLEQYKPKCKRITSFFIQLLSNCENTTCKTYPKNRIMRKLTDDEKQHKSEKIIASRSGRLWFTSPDLQIMKCVRDKNEVPSDWIRGMQTKDKIEKNRIGSVGRVHTKHTKLLLSEIAKTKMYYTSPDLQTVKVFYDKKDVPIDWIKGNKLQSRNERISESLRTNRYGNEKD